MAEKIIYDGIKDEQFTEPYIDIDEWRDQPVCHRYVHGGFHGTETRFCFYYPPKEEFKGRFFQKLALVQGPEDEAQHQEGEEDVISFSVLHGAYYVDTNLGGILNGGEDHTLVYRCSAQAAQFSRKVAMEMYACSRPFGYVFGGSGGGFKTMSCAENTTGIWDGAVPFVIGSPMAMPNVFTVRAHAMRLLRHKFPAVVDAIEPGGSGDPYAVLNEEEAEALREATAMGFPMDTWCEYETIGEGALPVLYPAIPAMDPSYFTDFWTKKGYLGSDETGSAVRDRIKLETTVKHIHISELGISGIAENIDKGNAYGVDEAWKHQIGKEGKLPVLELDTFPQGDIYSRGLVMRFLDGELAGQQINLFWLGYNLVTGAADASGRDLKELMEKIRVGDRVEMDNSDYIAAQTYHRHQVPESEYHAWYFFRDENGDPRYPQRPFLVAPILARQGCGSVQEGTPNCKMIILESLMDESTFPWQADWYRKTIMKNRGTDGNDIMRLWYMEHCMHTDCEEGNGGDHQHIVSYLGALYQALLDLSDWVERDIEPAATSGYSMEGGRVVIAERAKERKGIQPVVALKAGAEADGRIDVKAGEEVPFAACIELPEGSGDVELVTWDFEAKNRFLSEGSIRKTVWREDGTGISIAYTKHIYTRPGTYFPVVKVASNRTLGDRFTRVWNQARVRVVVSE